MGERRLHRGLCRRIMVQTPNRCKPASIAPAMRVFFTNLGCKLNQAEVDTLKRRFVASGHELAPTLEGADLHVVNSCTVTHLAARDSRKIARRGRRMNGAMRTVLTGCYATERPEEAASLLGVDLVVPNADKETLLARVHDSFPESVPPSAEAVPVPYVPLDFGLARALVKVEDGCNMRCSFCIIPSTRGRQVSRPLEDVVAEVRALTEGGYQEVVVTGVQISEYRDGGAKLVDLVRALLDDTDVPRLRVTSIAPWRFDDQLLRLWSERAPRLCRHVHLSLQSGATPTLRRMRRPYTARRYADLVARIRDAVPAMAVTTDVIVGFPGETESEFEDSLAFVERMAFAKPHIFTYSVREGTHAAGLPDHVPHNEKKRRVAAMVEVGRASEAAFRMARVGEESTVVWEEERRGRMTGLTDHYVRVYAVEEVSAGGVGRLETVVLGSGVGDGLDARPVGSGGSVASALQRVALPVVM